MTFATCEDCLCKGRRGDVIMSYREKSPLAIRFHLLCFPCYLKRDKRNIKRTHITIEPKVTA